MISLHLLLLIAAFFCFVATAAGVNSRVGLLPLGLALWVLGLIV